MRLGEPRAHVPPALGGEARAPLGVSVAAGMLASTLLTLVVIPVVYTLIDALQARVGRALRRRPASEAAT